MSELNKKKRVQKRMSVSPRMQQLMDGVITVEDLDDEEIAKGQLRAADGSFKGRPTNIWPREIAMAWAREGQKRHQEWVQGMVIEAQQTVRELNKKSLSPADATRLKAAFWILERYAGKTPDRVEIKAEVQTWEQVAEDILVDIEEDDDDFSK